MHFKSGNNSKTHTVSGIIITILLLFIPFIFFYELLFANHYWVNRIRLQRMFKNNKGELVHVMTTDIGGPKISTFDYTIDGVIYDIWLWHDSDLLTLDLKGGYGNDYIGLFITKLSVLKFGHKKLINKLKSKINEN